MSRSASWLAVTLMISLVPLASSAHAETILSFEGPCTVPTGVEIRCDHYDESGFRVQASGFGMEVIGAISMTTADLFSVRVSRIDGNPFDLLSADIFLRRAPVVLEDSVMTSSNAAGVFIVPANTGVVNAVFDGAAWRGIHWFALRLPTVGAHDVVARLDNVRVSSIPEPAMTTLVGMVLAVFALRRLRR
jgi:hypothetical protein